MDPAVRPHFEELVLLVESAAVLLSPLQDVFEATPDASARRDPYGRLLNFIDAEISDVLLGIASALPTMIPADAAWAEEADPAEVHADVELLVRYVTVAAMASRQPDVPPAARRFFTEAEEGLRGWEDGMIGVLRRIDDLVLRPALEEAA